MNSAFWRGKKVLITGHTGFKGGWLSLWLNQLGAKVHGYSLQPPTTPSFYEQANITEIMSSDTCADINDFNRLKQEFDTVEPEIVFHLAAQSLVRESYDDPLSTVKTNVLGTANVLEASRLTETIKAIILVTSDKVYMNLQTRHAYHEQDRLGGVDPYSASKAACEIISDSYRQSFFSDNSGHAAYVATARSGNVIGGGDWAKDRLVPDCLRAFAEGQAVRLRYPAAVRPWQHVLEPLAGYIKLAENLCTEHGHKFARSWNFGPQADNEASVSEVATSLAKLWGNNAEIIVPDDMVHMHEENFLKLDSSSAHKELGWKPAWSLDTALQKTVNWHRSWLQGDEVIETSLEQLEIYQAVFS